MPVNKGLFGLTQTQTFFVALAISGVFCLLVLVIMYVANDILNPDQLMLPTLINTQGARVPEATPAAVTVYPTFPEEWTKIPTSTSTDIPTVTETPSVTEVPTETKTPTAARTTVPPTATPPPTWTPRPASPIPPTAPLPPTPRPTPLPRPTRDCTPELNYLLATHQNSLTSIKNSYDSVVATYDAQIRKAAGQNDAYLIMQLQNDLSALTTQYNNAVALENSQYEANRAYLVATCK
jgi:hypothetical protein